MKDATKPPKKTAPTTTTPATPPYPPVIAPGDFKDEMPAPDFGAQKMEWQLKIGSLAPVKTKTGVLGACIVSASAATWILTIRRQRASSRPISAFISTIKTAPERSPTFRTTPEPGTTRKNSDETKRQRCSHGL